MESRVRELVHNYYWNDDANCAVTTLNILSEIFDILIDGQVIDSATGMHGAGCYGAQCGLVEGALMFIGIAGARNGLDVKTIEALCYDYASEFEKRFDSLLCRELRPKGFSPDNPPHICEDLTCRGILLSMDFVSGRLQLKPARNACRCHRG